MLRRQNARSGGVEGSTSFGLDPDLMTVFCRQYSHPKTNRLVQRLPLLPVGAPFLRQALFSDREYISRPIFDAIFRPQRRYLAAAVRLSSDKGDSSAVLTLFHDRLSRIVDQARLSRLQRLIPHLRRAVDLSARLAHLERERASLLAAFDLLPYGVLLVEAGGRCLFANRAAAGILEKRDGLSIRDGELRAATAKATMTLHRSITDAIRTSGATATRAGSATPLPRPSLRPPLSALAAPISPIRREFALADREPAAIVFVTDREQPSEVSCEALKSTYGLTAAEARVTQGLAEGRDLAAVAATLHISSGTARNHLKQVYAKTDTHRQSELVRLVLMACPALGRSHERAG